ncbi:MAG: DNA internalization-related competence protein ComEC/Rec2 [Planctomycetes bacterium]|nr:DNA internalization-related competence protein ComEC/Rec2 [Planctomycetota bacterium]
MARTRRPAVFLLLHLASGIAMAREPELRAYIVPGLVLFHLVGIRRGRAPLPVIQGEGNSPLPLRTGGYGLCEAKAAPAAPSPFSSGAPRGFGWLSLAAGGSFLALGWFAAVRAEPADPARLGLAVGDGALYRFEGMAAEPIREVKPEGRRPGRTLFDLVARSVETRDGTRAFPARLRVSVGGDLPPPSPGDEVRVLGRLERVRTSGNEGEFDLARELAARGVCGIVEVPDRALISPSGAPTSTPERWSSALRRRAREGVARHFRGRERQILVRVTIGPWEEMDPEVAAAFRDSGTSHLLAVSGLHVSVLVALFWCAVRTARLPRLPASVLLALLVAGYALVVGLAPSVLRAAGVAIFALVAHRVGRPVDALQLLAVVATLHLLFSPLDLWDAGFQLSYAATVGVLWAAGELRRRRPAGPTPLALLGESLRQRVLRAARRWLLESAVISGAAWLATAPLAAFHFGTFAPVAILANLILVPLFVLVLWGGVLFHLAALAGLDSLAGVIALPLGAALSLGAWLTILFAALPGAGMAVGSPGVAGTGLLLAALLLPVLTGPGRRRLVAGAASLAILLGAILLGAKGGGDAPEVVFLDVGNGGATVLHLPGGRTALYDAGSADRLDVGRTVVERYLRCRGVTSLDTVFVSHGDLDHWSGLPYLLETYRPARLVTTARVLERAPALATIAESAGTRVVVAGLGDRFDLGSGVEALVLGPAPGPALSDNDHSLVILVSWQGRRVLLTGDIEAPGIADLLARGVPRAEVLVLPHHGEGLPGLEELLAATRPRIAVSPARRGWTDEGTREVCRAAGAALLVTGEDGAVRVRFAPAGLEARAYRNVRRRP